MRNNLVILIVRGYFGYFSTQYAICMRTVLRGICLSYFANAGDFSFPRCHFSIYLNLGSLSAFFLVWNNKITVTHTLKPIFFTQKNSVIVDN